MASWVRSWAVCWEVAPMRAAEHSADWPVRPTSTEHATALRQLGSPDRSPDREWMDQAACGDRIASPASDVFFAPDAEEAGGRAAATSEARRRELIALAVCDRCPVRPACLAYAVATRQQLGVWGGRTEQQL